MPGESIPKASDADDSGAQIREELRKILESDAFKGGKRAQDFLQRVVEHALAGRLDNLRERMLGVEMFGRRVDYDTANDAVVRVKATEVRRRLGQYYQGLQSPVSIRIQLPPGSYVPQFVFDAASSAGSASETDAQAPAPAATTQASRPPGVSRLLVIIGGGALVAAIITFAILLWKHPPAQRPIRSIAILPLANYSGDPSEEYFADGMTENLITELGQISSLRVISRTSSMTYKGTQKTIPTIARELSVDAVVEGSVERQGDRVRITAQLIDARGDQHLWARSYDRNVKDTLGIQSEVAKAISQEISVELTPTERARLNRNQQVSPEALDLYMKGMQQFGGVSPQDAIDTFQRAVDKDPGFGEAHAALADAYGWAGEAGRMPYVEAFEKQKQEALKAIDLDNAIPEPHLELAFAALDQNWDWLTSRNEMQKALVLNPNSTKVHWAYAYYLIRTGDRDGATTEANTAMQLDPVSARAYVDHAFIDYFARRYDAALDDLGRAANLPHTPQEFHFPLGDIYAEKGMYSEAAEKFKELGGPHAIGHLGNVYARWGRSDEARSVIQELKQEVQKSGIGRYEIALIFAALGDKDSAFSWLESAFQARDKGMLYLKIDPCLDPLRSDSRFQELIKRVGFPS